ncbi:MAG: hypothetical protein JNM66_21455 [Bryobacterales bacterium]|nr:hypothetical protein [Bryobacterales bacterium]
MPTLVHANDGDCLCGIASTYGYFDCGPLRALPENAAYLNRELRQNDIVTVPDLAVEDHAREVDTRHVFQLLTSPPINIRFVHGSPNLPYRDDPTSPVLFVSNFVTNLAGADGLQRFTDGYGYETHADADGDTFKVEVWDPAAGASVNVRLEALQPVYNQQLEVDAYVPFATAGRFIDPLVCNAVGAGTENTYRSKYMRLVVDEEDLATPSNQGQFLLVSDIADGLGTGLAADNDTVEILDQLVRATYEVQRCPGNPRCRVSTSAPISLDFRRRLRLHFHIIRENVGANTIPGGVPIPDVQRNIRLRVYKYFRRIYAQAHIAPRISGFTIYDPPARNMICLSHAQGAAAAVAGQIDIHITTEAGNAFPFPSVPVDLNDTPLQIGERIVASLPPGLNGHAFPTPLQRNAAHPACDVVIHEANGLRLIVSITANTSDVSAEVPNVNLAQVQSGIAEDSSPSMLTIELKRLLQLAAVDDDALHCIVVGGMLDADLMGQAFPSFGHFPASHRPPLPYRSAVVVAYYQNGAGVLNEDDTNPSLLAHEAAHALSDYSHTNPAGPHAYDQLLQRIPPLFIPFDAAKRINDDPFSVSMELDSIPAGVYFDANLTQTILAVGDGKLERW